MKMVKRSQSVPYTEIFLVLSGGFLSEYPKHSRGLYFSKALFEGLIFGEAYIRRDLSTEGNLRFKIDWASPIVGRKFTVLAGGFGFVLLCI